MIPTLDKTMPPQVLAAFKEFPAPVRETLERVRALIFHIADQTANVGPLTETLKWGEPAYLTEATGSGSTIRLGQPKGRPTHAAVYFNCRTTIVSAFRDMFPNGFDYSGNRAIVLPTDRPIDEDALRLCIGMALTYHSATVRRGRCEPDVQPGSKRSVATRRAGR